MLGAGLGAKAHWPSVGLTRHDADDAHFSLGATNAYR
jgi:hypothetical protein